MKNFFKSMLSDERGAVSSKRIIGFMCATFLCVTMALNSYSHESVKPSDKLVDAVLAIACICIGASTVDKFTSIVKNNNTES